jgi:biotin synthase-like enzyme
MKDEFIKDIHYYLENGRVVFTTLFHLQRGSCCGNKCRHCAYSPQYEKGNTKTKEEDFTDSN